MNRNWMAAILISSGSLLVSCSQAPAPWGVHSRVSMNIPHADDAGLLSLCFSSNGKLLATGGFGGPSVWNTARGQRQSLSPPRTIACTAAIFSPNDRLLATLSLDERTLRRVARVWRGTPWKALYTVKGVPAAFSADSRLLVTLDSRPVGVSRTMQLIQVWDMGNGRLTRSIPLDSPGIDSAAFSPDGRLFAVESPAQLALWDAKSWRVLRIVTFEAAGAPRKGSSSHELAFSPDGKLLAAACGKWQVNLWRTEDCAMVRRLRLIPLKGGSGITRVEFSSDGKMLLGVHDGLVTFWNTSSWQQSDLVLSPPPGDAEGREATAALMPGSLMLISADGRAGWLTLTAIEAWSPNQR
jgi:WD40 repeat protein